MFSECRSFNFNQRIDIKTANVTNTSDMFKVCISINQPIDIKTANAIDMSGMFHEFSSLYQGIGFNLLMLLICHLCSVDVAHLTNVLISKLP